MERKKARDAGEKFYSTDVPCANGHASERYTRNGKCVQCNREKRAKWRCRDKKAEYESARKTRLKVVYDMKEGMYEALLDKQNGVCAICGGTCTNGHTLYVDHDHKTGMIRGLLCNRCNFGIGYFKDNQTFLAAAIEYLNRAEEALKIF
jgi:Autographiviridae endonuclease VII